MSKYYLNLQLFGEGGDGGSSAGSAGSTGTEGGTTDGAIGKGESLDEVVYGKQDVDSIAESSADKTTPAKDSKKSFDDLIKGEFKEDFEKKTQAIINKRFKETKGLQEQLASHDSIMSMLADKYGVDASDVSALQKAIEEDDSFYEDEALEKGLSVKQLKEVKALERENAEFKRAKEEAERRANSDRIYSEWTQQADALKEKYGLGDDFSLQNEIQNPDFTRLLRSGISVESAYMAIHMDQMLSGAMAKTASTVRSQMANNIASRQSRPSENGLSTVNSSQIFKSDPTQFTDKDMIEIRRRVMRGERITL